jgi:hypothetical protein
MFLRSAGRLKHFMVEFGGLFSMEGKMTTKGMETSNKPDRSATYLESPLSLRRNVSKMELYAAIEKSRGKAMTPMQREAQMVSFVWGNAPEGNRGTADDVREHLNLSRRGV